MKEYHWCAQSKEIELGKQSKRPESPLTLHCVDWRTKKNIKFRKWMIEKPYAVTQSADVASTSCSYNGVEHSHLLLSERQQICRRKSQKVSLEKYLCPDPWPPKRVEKGRKTTSKMTWVWRPKLSFKMSGHNLKMDRTLNGNSKDKCDPQKVVVMYNFQAATGGHARD